MADLSMRQRKGLGSSSFAVPSKAPGSGSYPIPDLAHARNALARVAQFGTPAEQAEVRAAVYRKFPQLKKSSSARSAVVSRLSSNY